MKKTTKQPQTPNSKASEQNEGLDFMIERLKRLLEQSCSAAERTKGSSKHVRDALAAIAELRKIEGARAKRVTELTMAQVVAWLRQLEPDARSQVARELHSMDRRGGVLG